MCIRDSLGGLLCAIWGPILYATTLASHAWTEETCTVLDFTGLLDNNSTCHGIWKVIVNEEEPFFSVIRESFLAKDCSYNRYLMNGTYTCWINGQKLIAWVDTEQQLPWSFAHFMIGTGLLWLIFTLIGIYAFWRIRRRALKNIQIEHELIEMTPA
eukprot:TRINITY_DN15141_c0_g1_i1.p1 TRINITY_DN15141_c0_g1~~TRINITY_DN15141_c0_g1_i1.p1  ORF type:complete len:156 (-),score=15.91 TRINITY_DN15141_c0_g1_i1:130-597(-)